MRIVRLRLRAINAPLIGFFVMLAVLGWHADAGHKKAAQAPLPAIAVAF